MTDSTHTTAVIINFRTPVLTQRAFNSFRSFYPGVAVLLIDNGARDSSRDDLSVLVREHPENTNLLANQKNIHHGPAMDQALRHLTSPCVLFLDSDSVVTRGGFLERMVDICDAEPAHYAVGEMTWMNDRGYDMPEYAGGHPYIRPVCMLIRRHLYLTLPPFERHGAPCLKNMQAAVQNSLQLIHYPINEYVAHEGRGTAARHGYRLGFKGRLNHLLNRIGF